MERVELHARAVIKRHERIYGIELPEKEKETVVRKLTETSGVERNVSYIPIGAAVGWDKEILHKYIRNPEIAEYFEDMGVTVKDYLALIHHGFRDIREKVSDIARLAEIYSENAADKKKNLDEHGRAVLSDSERILLAKELYEKVCSEIFNPSDRSLYFVKYVSQSDSGESTSFSKLLDTRINADTVLDTIDEILEGEKAANQEIPFLDIPGRMEIEAEQIIIREKTGHDIGVRFHVGWNGEKAIIYRFDILNNERNDRMFGLEYRSRMERAYEEMDEAAFFLPLPYESGTLLKLQTPLLTEPIIGKLESYKDGVGFWYHHLYAEDADPEKTADYIDLSYLDINIADTYTSYDWIEQI